MMAHGEEKGGRINYTFIPLLHLGALGTLAPAVGSGDVTVILSKRESVASASERPVPNSEGLCACVPSCPSRQKAVLARAFRYSTP